MKCFAKILEQLDSDQYYNLARFFYSNLIFLHNLLKFYWLKTKKDNIHHILWYFSKTTGMVEGIFVK